MIGIAVRVRAGAQLSDELETAHPGHQLVRYEEVGHPAPLQTLQRLLAIGGLGDRVTETSTPTASCCSPSTPGYPMVR